MSRIREQFSTAALILSVMALVFALMGGAYAASHAQQKKTVVKRGPRGPKGATGPAGLAGPQGPAGANGKNGTNGTNGTKGEQGGPGADGTNGEPGESPVGAPFTGAEELAAFGEEPCNGSGGIEYEVESTGDSQILCNGRQGVDGEEGSPWTDGGTLPPGATETGYWLYTAPPQKIEVDVGGAPQEIQIGTAGIYAPISFPIPFPFNLKEEHTHYLDTNLAFQLAEGQIHGNPGELCEGKEGAELTACEAEKEALHAACPSPNFLNPKAAPGELCVYENGSQASFEGIFRTPSGAGGARKYGAIVQFEPSEAGAVQGWGGWAVTGCEEEPGAGECKTGS
jgi:Collagen triple helix repeat (20 copies)